MFYHRVRARSTFAARNSDCDPRGEIQNGERGEASYGGRRQRAYDPAADAPIQIIYIGAECILTLCIIVDRYNWSLSTMSLPWPSCLIPGISSG